MRPRQAHEQAVKDARRQLAVQLARAPGEANRTPPTAPSTAEVVAPADGGGTQPSGQPPPASDLEAVAQLRQRKRAANDQWLRTLSVALWCGVAFVAALSLGAVHVQNQGPAPLRQIDALTDRAQEAVDDLRAVLLDGGDVIDDAARAATLDIASDLEGTASALARGVEGLPGSWLGRSLTTERRELSAAVAEVRAVSRELGTLPADVSRRDVGPRVDRAAGAVERLAGVDASPGTTWPWDYERQTAAAFVYAVLLTLGVLALLSLLLRATGGLRYFLIGGDGRLSTSQTQAAIWTVAIFFLLAHLLLRPQPGDFDALDENYLLLLGGPYAAWVISGAVTRGKLDQQVLQKVNADEAQARDLVTDDNGRASLTDAQFFLFSMLALVGALVAFAQDPSELPEINTGLAMLSGAAALLYTGKKSLDRNAPVVFSVTRAQGEGPITSGTQVVVHGTNFVPPGGGGDLDVLAGVVVRFTAGGTVVDQPIRPQPGEGADTAPEVRTSVANPSPERLLVVVPRLPAGTGSLRVITASGAQTADHPLHLAEPVSLLQLRLEPASDGSRRIRAVGSGLAPAGNRSSTKVAVAGSTAVAVEWIADDTLIVPVPADARGDVTVKVSNHHGSAEETVSLP